MWSSWTREQNSNNAISCANCKGSHFAYSRECPKWKQQKQVQQVRVEKQVSFPEARRLVETMSGAVAGKSYATTVMVSTTNASVETDLTWPNGVDRFIKVSAIQKAQKQATKAVQKQWTSVALHASFVSLNSHEACTSGKPRQKKPAQGLGPTFKEKSKKRDGLESDQNATQVCLPEQQKET